MLEVFLLGVIFGAILIIFTRSSKINELEERIVRAIVWIENSDDEKQSTPYDISRETKQALLDILTDVEKGISMNNDKIIDFNLYCERCKHKEVDDTKGQEPCNTCLAYPAMQNSSKPLYFEEADSEEVEVEKID